MTIKLIAFDIDDTLLSSAKVILPSTIAAVHECLARGLKIVLCTGRPLAGVAPFLAELGVTGDDQYVVTYNGAVTETVSGRLIISHLIDRAGYAAMTDFAAAHRLPFNVVDPQSAIITADHDLDPMIVVQAYENRAGVLIREPGEMPADFAIAKGVFVGTEAQLDAAENAVRVAFSPRFSVIRAGRQFLEVMALGIDKGKALLALGEQLGILPEEMMAFGDEENDLAMFDAVGTAVAMGNGTDVAKAHADVVTASNDEDGIAKALASLVLGDTGV
ncbi:Cof-type HAD-IIB family hydrolase [Lacticaseibacillus mingshuiensis]|uniref:Cof-type HAD-IIB family hydrolase n=1 Tax=Lacticaseibacillus mingshuiensis TaxID=2799574 RepID=A0ABW4CMH6_9LACO|nr:Cof-type HAD-IIB family hydrolase [Lacticaseibacillus mingshuiensis]